MQEKKRSRGRPATGRERNVKFSFFVTEEERKTIKEKATEQDKTVANYIMDLVNKK